MENKHKNLILDIIKQNERYAGNEEYLEAIYEDALTRLGGILDSLNDEAIIKSYVERIAKLSIITVAKKNSSTPAAKQKPAEPEIKQELEKEAEEDLYKVFGYEPSSQPKENITTDKFQEIEKGIMQLDKAYPTKEFIKLYKLRFQENKTLEEISDELNVSQAQAAERLFDIAALVKRTNRNEVSQV